MPQIEELYPGKRWGTFDLMQKTYNCDSSKSFTDLPYIFFDTAFVSPVIPLVSKQIQALSAQKNDYNDKCHSFYLDLADSLTFNYHPDNFKLGTGFYFPKMINNTSDYIEKASPQLINKLKQLRNNGIKILLMTASHIDYTELLMNYCYGDNWKDLFDVICCRIKKPGFFSFPANTRPFYIWNEKESCAGLDAIAELNTTDIFLEGHWSVVDKWIRSQEGSNGITAYVGDSFKSDILPTKLYTSWKIIAVVQEGRKFMDGMANHEHINKKRHIIDSNETFGTFFGSKEKPTMNAGKLLEHSDLTINDIEVLRSIEEDEELNVGNGNFYQFYPFEVEGPH